MASTAPPSSFQSADQAAADILQSPPVLALRACASLAACCLFASLLPDMLRVRSLRDVGVLPALPILSMLANCLSWGLYGLLKRDYFPLVATNAVGLSLSGFYLAIYCMYSRPASRPALKAQLAATSLLALVLVLPVAASSEASRPGVQAAIGFVSVVLAAVMVGSPLVAVRQVLRTRRADALPTGMIVAGAVNSALWLAYGLVIDDVVVIAPNVLNLAIGVGQLALVCVFRSRDDYTTVEKLDTAVDGDAPPVATPQVKPVGKEKDKEQEQTRGIELVVTSTPTSLSPRSRKAAALAAL